MTYPDLNLPADGKLARNITYFACALRKAGLPIGTGRLLDAIAAVQVAGFTQREDFYHTLHACFVSRPEHRAVFAQIFRLYWRETLRITYRRGGDIQTFATNARRTRSPNLVVLCDISGSMSSYSRAVLHFMHSVADHNNGSGAVHTFTFGTRLTNITRHLRTRDMAQRWRQQAHRHKIGRAGTCLRRSIATGHSVYWGRVPASC